ncbi:hypothetical protein RN001_006134 [Aquatica leii]|uniref:Uncharacterized protein n=1 Tax=Aquatica leii TaxID=1421715 RepID=A0AAN7Q8L3_9COLE|nr:hypothetical protein RN001_006134 [Aquatica leii]
MNPVLPSPWRSTAPLGYSKHSKRRPTYRQYLDLFNNSNAPVLQQMEESKMDQQEFHHQDSLFRNLNRNTLILTFPGVNVKHIDRTLDMCNNNLSQAINFLQTKLVETQNNIKRQLSNQSTVSHFPQSSTQIQISQSVLNTTKGITYIPTKYKDVQIVELNNNSNRKFVPLLPRISQKIFSAPPQVREESTSTYSPLSSASSQQSDSITVENNRDKQQQKSLSPNQILERALTFYSPYPQDN